LCRQREPQSFSKGGCYRFGGFSAGEILLAGDEIAVSNRKPEPAEWIDLSEDWMPLQAEAESSDFRTEFDG